MTLAGGPATATATRNQHMHTHDTTGGVSSVWGWGVPSHHHHHPSAAAGSEVPSRPVLLRRRPGSYAAGERAMHAISHPDRTNEAAAKLPPLPMHIIMLLRRGRLCRAVAIATPPSIAAAT